MSNGVIFADRDWIVAGWVARSAVDAILDHLSGPDAPVCASRLREVHGYNGALADFESASSSELATLASAARRALEAEKAQGPSTWKEPEFFPAYLERFRELVAMLDEVAPPDGLVD